MDGFDLPLLHFLFLPYCQQITQITCVFKSVDAFGLDNGCLVLGFLWCVLDYLVHNANTLAFFSLLNFLIIVTAIMFGELFLSMAASNLAQCLPSAACASLSALSPQFCLRTLTSHERGFHFLVWGKENQLWLHWLFSWMHVLYLDFIVQRLSIEKSGSQPKSSLCEHLF